MACIVSLAFLFSALTDSSLTALIAAIVVYIVIGVLASFSYFDWLRPWVFPTYFENYLDFFRDPIDWRPVLKAWRCSRRGAAGSRRRRGCSSAARTCCRRTRGRFEGPFRGREAGVLVRIAVALFAVAEGVNLIAVGWDALPLVAAWGAAALVLALLAHFVRAPNARLLVSAALLPLCVLLTFEGGLFFVPAAAVLLLAALRDRRVSRRAGTIDLGGP